MHHRAHPVRWLLLMLVTWAAAALACNLPAADLATMAPPPTAGATLTVEPTATTAVELDVAPATIPAVLPTVTAVVPGTETAVAPAAETAVAPTPALLPTFTPIAAPTLAATFTPRPTTVAPVATATQPATATPSVQGPLRFTYEIHWRFAPDNPFLVIARVTIRAQGGDGVYSYYHDDIRQAGATFEFNWVACRPKPGSLRVDSGDGQSVREDYYQETPCPTPTPVP
jgi:hypothetical protein